MIQNTFFIYSGTNFFDLKFEWTSYYNCFKFMVILVENSKIQQIQFLKPYIVQGVSYWSMQSKSALRGRRINNFIDLWCLVASGGLDICVSSTSFQKNDIGWPQQPLTERVSDISEKLDFWRSIPQKRTSIGHFGAKGDQTIIDRKYLEEIGL